MVLSRYHVFCVFGPLKAWYLAMVLRTSWHSVLHSREDVSSSSDIRQRGKAFIMRGLGGHGLMRYLHRTAYYLHLTRNKQPHSLGTLTQKYVIINLRWSCKILWQGRRHGLQLASDRLGGFAVASGKPKGHGCCSNSAHKAIPR